MSTPALTFGSALVAFGPFLSLFTLLVYQKAQLVIVVTSSAFAFLLASLLASIAWWIFHSIGLNGPLAAIIPGVVAQFFGRCAFVALYHRVEKVIQTTVDSEEKRAENTNGQQHPSARTDVTVTAATTENNWSEAAKLRLELNDAACGVASGVGFGGMHAILLYGTLLAAETGGNVGILYQNSCPSMPSLTLSAIYAFLFSILDMFWMLFTFFGMRRRLMFHRADRTGEEELAVGSWLGNSRTGGNLALLFTFVTHFVASILTTADYFHYGCTVSLPTLGALVLFVAYIFWAGVGRIYMPPNKGSEGIYLNGSRVVESSSEEPDE